MAGAIQRRMAGAAALATVVVLSAVVVQMSSAAFTAQTDSASNSWNTGYVELTNLTGHAVFDVTGMVPGQVEERCVLVDYKGVTGSAAVDIRMYGDGAIVQGGDPGGLSNDLIIEISSVGVALAGDPGTCSGFLPEPDTTYEGTLADFANSANSWQGGLEPAWIQNGNGVRTYRIRVTLDENSDKVSSSVTGYSFRWEARTVALP